MAALGEELFRSPLISEDGKVSCSSCHSREHGLAEPSARSSPPGRATTATNSTTLYNIGYLHVLTWNGAFDSLEAHLDALIQNPKLMASSWFAVGLRLGEHPEWQERFAQVFPDGLTPEHAREVLLAYERSLATPNAPIDLWLAGDDAALGADARRGYQLFIDYGCASCHQGSLIGGNVFQRLGVARDYIADHPDASNGSIGRYAVTRREEDRYVFRVPSLRNVALTAPYLHDGSARTLESAIATMGKYQLGWELPDEDIALIAAFLGALTGQVPSEAPQ